MKCPYEQYSVAEEECALAVVEYEQEEAARYGQEAVGLIDHLHPCVDVDAESREVEGQQRLHAAQLILMRMKVMHKT